MFFPSQDPSRTLATSLGTLASTPAQPLHHFSLANGLTVYLREDHRVPQASVQLWYHVGTSHEPNGHSNLSHLLEHLIFQGSSKLAPGQYSRILGQLGGQSNASTRDDATVFDVTLPSARVEVALEIMADTMASARLDPAEFELERKTVDDERRLKFDNAPDQLAYDRHLSLAHGDSPYGAPVFGHAIDLAEMTLDTARTWYASWYHPNNATLVVVGAVTAQQLRQWVERQFGGLPAVAVRAQPIPRHSAALTERRQNLTLQGLRDGLFMSFNTPSLTTATSPQTVHALRLAVEVLAQGFSSRLYGQLVRDKPVFNGISADYDFLRRGDTLLTLSAYSNPATGTPQQAAEQVLGILDEARQTPFSAEVLQRAKLRLMARQIYARNSFQAQSEVLGRHAIGGRNPALADDELQLIEQTRADHVQQALQDCLSRQRLTLTTFQGAQP
ncbi:putative zinc protease y4wA [Pseudomonas reidholzensis]|uniref:Putative zinc protease y4wA n=1 Tax=Pseudomonas reidholzensis TaxID=1785162 RepID=A0A383S2P5_9PSED|nr:pitrilysin family protein [Pseudomonas reidholzensis]SYX92971.1 putative zinc protease y4wA [Pseudomonas reidholzensis]